MLSEYKEHWGAAENSPVLDILDKLDLLDILDILDNLINLPDFLVSFLGIPRYSYTGTGTY